MNITHKFAIGFLLFFGAFLLYFNFCLVFGMTPFPGFLVPDSQNMWTSDYYFGFDSVFSAFDAFPSTVWLNDMDKNLDYFANSLGGLANIVNHIDQFVQSGDIFALLRVLVDIFTAPLQAIFYFLVITVKLIMTIIQFIAFAYQLIAGRFNSPVAPYQTGLDTIDHVVTLSVNGTGNVVWH